MAHKHLDVLIVGAGLSGIGAAHHLLQGSPGKSFEILEARGSLGGTWDLFRYPGVRSDSDMHTLGFAFRPWKADKALADGPSILAYLRETAEAEGITDRIRYNRRVRAASWSSGAARWSVEVENTEDGSVETITTGFLFGCTGYYRYDEGYTPDFPGLERFRGEVVHPQLWNEDLDYTGKRVVVIGSGATAVTLVPAMTDRATHVTMLQRSPTYVVSVPGEDPVARLARRFLPARVAHPLVRWKNIALQTAIYQLSQRRPEFVKGLIRKGLQRMLPAGYDIDKHFKPRYNPWDQRMCLVPDADLFKAISRGDASIVTDQIESFTEAGIKLQSGEELEADIVVTATGLNLLAFGGIALTVDGVERPPADTLAYRGMMLSGVPNFAFAIGYTNASWTLKVDLTAEYVSRLLNHMDALGYASCTPEPDSSIQRRPLLDFEAGYVLRSLDEFPGAGSESPWKVRMNYPLDRYETRRAPFDDGSLRFEKAAVTAPEPVAA